MKFPDEIWITDTTFRDGQQARAPYTTEQIVKLYDMMHRLGGPKGKIRQCEFFLYSENDRKAIRACQDLGMNSLKSQAGFVPQRRFPTCKRYGIERMWYIG